MSLLKWIAGLRESISQAPSGSRFTLVSGNESADLDSVLSAISYAFLAASQSQERFLPLVNIPRADLALRRDIEYVLGRQSIQPSSLLFSDDIEADFVSRCELDLVLVDHNAPQGAARGLVAQGVTVSGIIDHHKDEGLFPEAHPRIIRTCGSCSSLVLNYWSGKVDKNALREVRDVLVAPLLIDTANLSQRIEQPDVQAVQTLRELGLAEEGQFYTQISAEKSNLKGMNVRDILRKDYKEYTVGDKKVGISSTVKSFQWLKGEYGQDLGASVEAWYQERGLDAHITMCSFEEGVFRRQIGFHGRLGDEIRHKLADKLELEPIQDGFYEQHNLKASRKQVAPLVEESLA